MTLYDKFQAAIHQLALLSVKPGASFFKKEVVPGLEKICGLMTIPQIQHQALQAYLHWFRTDIQIDIDRCYAISDDSTVEERAQLLELIQKHVSPKLKVLEFALAYYLKDTSLLFGINKRTEAKNSKRWLQDDYVPRLFVQPQE